MQDNTNLPELTRRQEEILSLIIKSYTQKPEPVGSKFLKEAYDLAYSTATIRNEMVVLDELGYIASPHTSSGRIPTEQGYRYFVKRLIDLDVDSLMPSERVYLAERFQDMPRAMETWLRNAARQLARTVHVAALVTPPIAESIRFKHLELISIQGRLCLMVLVFQAGQVHQQMLNLAEPLSQTRLSEVANRINNTCINLDANETRRKGMLMGALEREVCELAAEIMEREDRNQVRFVYRDGLSDIVSHFSTEGAQQVVRVFEESAMLNMIIDEFVEPLEGNDVQVVIAGEGRWEELSHLTMILSRYGIPRQASGMVGVLGPTHINYTKAVGTVRYVAELMTNSLQDLYRETPPTLADGEDSDEDTHL